MKPHHRPFRFPPLSQLTHGTAGAGAGAGAGEMHAADGAGLPAPQLTHAEGYQHGVERGYQDGLAAGRQAGHEEGLAQGHQEGLIQGRAQGREEAQRQFASLAAPLDEAVNTLKSMQADYQAAVRKEVIELVEVIARQVIRAELTLRPVQLLNLVDEALAALPPVRDGVEVFLNPEECERIRELDPARASRWTLIPDAQLASGECRVKTGGQEVDVGCRQRLQACMAQVKAQIAEPLQTDVPAEAQPDVPAAQAQVNAAPSTAKAPSKAKAKGKAAQEEAQA